MFLYAENHEQFKICAAITKRPATPNQQVHIAICDDESIDRQQAADLTREIMEAEGLACDLSGYESAAALRKLGDATCIIFISSDREMALRGYEVSAAPQARPFFHRPVLSVRF